MADSTSITVYFTKLANQRHCGSNCKSILASRIMLLRLYAGVKNKLCKWKYRIRLAV